MNSTIDETTFQQPRDHTLRQTSSENIADHPHPTISRRSHSERLGQYRSPLDNDLPPLPRPELSPEDRRQSMVALDRKRRLTASAYEQGRRRTTTGGFTSRDNRYHLPQARRDSQRSVSDQREVIDLTSSSPVREETRPTIPIPVRSTRTPSISSRSYVVPKWQPDTEASECPICHRQFGFLFRRHHCRKCGRVVCNDCSPHRITIPRQYIVHPSGMDELSASPSDAPVIDLTTLDEDDERSPNARNYYGRAAIGLGGGEKVRLCNPCVPDPQPELEAVLREGPSRMYSRADESLRSAPPALTSFPQFARNRDESQLYGSFPHPGTRLPFDNEEETPDSSPEAHPSASRWMANMAGRALPFPNQHPVLNHLAHSRYHSLDSRQAPLPPLPPPAGLGSRPLDQAMLERLSRAYALSPPLNHSLQSRHSHHSSISSASHGNPQPQSSRMSRPRIREEDTCPVCRRMLPPKGTDGDETERENHIMQCISQHDPAAMASPSSRPAAPSTSSSLPAHSRTHTFGNSGPTLPIEANSSTNTPHSLLSQHFAQPPPPVTHMVRFTATEKDCGTTGSGLNEQQQECSICMVEYEVSDRLVRLECWCKFHEECIVEWFGRKAECPVHKLN